MDTVFNDTTEEAYNFSSPVDPTIIFGPKRDSLIIVIPITIIYVVIFITGLVGNIFTCIVIVRNKSMHTATNYYLFSLAISDLLLLVSGMPQEMYSIWSKWPYVFGHTFCLIRGLAAETSTNASVLTITLFTIERYLAICHPFLSHKMSKLSRATKHVLLLWAAAFALALPQALQFSVAETRGVVMCLQTRVIIQHSFEISTLFFFFTPMVLISVLYALIGLRLRKTTLCKQNKGEEDFDRNMRFTHPIRRKPSQSTKRVIKMLVAVVVAFFVCWAPFHAQRLVAIYGTGEQHEAISSVLLFVYSVLTYISGVFYYMSTCINPIFYHIMSNKFREAFKNTMKQCCCRRRAEAGLRARCSYTAVARNHNSSTNHSGNSMRMDTPQHWAIQDSGDNVHNLNGHKRLCRDCRGASDDRRNHSTRMYPAQGRQAPSISRDTQTMRTETTVVNEKRKRCTPPCCSYQDSPTETVPTLTVRENTMKQCCCRRRAEAGLRARCSYTAVARNHNSSTNHSGNSMRMDTPQHWTKQDSGDNVHSLNGHKRLCRDCRGASDDRRNHSTRMYPEHGRQAPSISRDTQTMRTETTVVNEKRKRCTPPCCSYQDSPTETVPTLTVREVGSSDNETDVFLDERKV